MCKIKCTESSPPFRCSSRSTPFRSWRAREAVEGGVGPPTRAWSSTWGMERGREPVFFFFSNFHVEFEVEFVIEIDFEIRKSNRKSRMKSKIISKMKRGGERGRQSIFYS